MIWKPDSSDTNKIVTSQPENWTRDNYRMPLNETQFLRMTLKNPQGTTDNYRPIEINTYT